MPKKIVSYPGGVEGLYLMCNSPGCADKTDGILMMQNPGTNKSVFECPGCGCCVIIGVIEGEEVLVGVCVEQPPENIVEKSSGAKSKCLHLHGFYLEGGAKFCNVCAEEI